VDANETYNERNAAITFTSGDKQQIVTVTQKQKDALIVTSNKVEMGADGGYFTVEVKANVKYQYEIEEAAQSWLALDASRALTTSSLKFKVQKNEKTSQRIGTIIISFEELRQEIEVIQNANFTSEGNIEDMPEQEF
jgi:VCBS repeat-containing protein